MPNLSDWLLAGFVCQMVGAPGPAKRPGGTGFLSSSAFENLGTCGRQQLTILRPPHPQLSLLVSLQITAE